MNTQSYTREVFLDTYGFGQAKEYFLNLNGEHYDSKAIVGVAAKFLPSIARPLLNNEFSGGEHQVEKLLMRLGFVVDRIPNGVPAVNPFERGKIYIRQKEIHGRFGGQQRGGISTPSSPFVFLFTGEHGSAFGYQDGERPDGVFEFTGEGQTGDMRLIKGNKAIRDHAENGKDLLLFRALKQKGQYRFLGTYVCDDFQWRMAKDKSGALRKVVVFELLPLENVEAIISKPGVRATATRSLDELRRRAYAAAENSGGKTGVGTRTIYTRSADVRDYVLERAEGICEACDKPAPFNRTDGTPYLEPHHTRRLSDGGPDHPRWVGAICPTCHRLIHHGAEGRWVNANLENRLKIKESKDSP